MLLALVLTLASVVVGCGQLGDTEPVAVPDDPAAFQARAAAAMGEVETVRFALTASGDPVFIDPLATLALVAADGRVAVPDADALLTVEVSGSLQTRLGAIAVGSDAWLSNPITGDFEPLPEEYGIDPSRFFDPQGAWRPLLENLTDATIVGAEEDGVLMTAVARGDDVRRVTAGLARAVAVPAELWLDAETAEVNRIRFTTEIDGSTTTWDLRLSEYGTDVVIEPPATTP